MLKTKGLMIAGLGLSLVLVGAFAFKTQSEPAVTTLESAMFEKTKTVCFGRFLIDIPKNVELKYHDNNYLVAKINTGFDVRKYREMVDATLKKLKNKEGRYEYVSSEYPEDSDKQIIVSRVDLFGDMSYAVNAFTLNPKYIPGSGYFFYLYGKSYDENRMDEIISDYRDIISSVRYRPDYDIPKEPGFCFQDGFVKNDGKTSQVETAILQFRLKDYPDVGITIDSDIRFVEDTTLLQRMGKVKNELIKQGAHILSEKKRTINGIDGEEFMMYAKSPDGTGLYHSFIWDTNGELDNPLKPGIHLEVETANDVDGNETTSSLTTSQARELYEAIVKTIRLRPVNEPAPKPESQAPEAFPRRLATGESCPKTGRWRCVETGQTRFLTQGQRLPEAAFFKPATGLLNRIQGVKRIFSHVEPGHWEWVGEEKNG